jgi:hypothetical protein
MSVLHPAVLMPLSVCNSGRTQGPPPVHLRNSPFCGDLDMRIAGDGPLKRLGTEAGNHHFLTS